MFHYPKKNQNQPGIETTERVSLPSRPPSPGLCFGLLLVTATLPLAAQTDSRTTTTPVTMQSVTTSTTTVSARVLYLRSSYDGMLKNGAEVFIRPNGRIYNQDAEYIGHLTDLDGDDLMSVPDDHRYKIRNLDGAVIASTKLSSAFDSNRTISLAREDSDGHLLVEATSTITPMVPVVPATTVQSSTTTTTTQAPTPATPSAP